HAHRDSSGRAGPVSRDRKRADRSSGAQYGARSRQSPGIHRLCEIRAAAGGRGRRKGQRIGAARVLHLDGDRARAGIALTSRLSVDWSALTALSAVTGARRRANPRGPGRAWRPAAGTTRTRASRPRRSSETLSPDPSRWRAAFAATPYFFVRVAWS